MLEQYVKPYFQQKIVIKFLTLTCFSQFFILRFRAWT